MIPHVIELQRQFGAKGLHIFAIECQGHSAEEIRKLLVPKGVNYPVGLGSMIGQYETGGGIPHGWLIGVDGKVLWEGNPKSADLDGMIKAEIAKVKYPGLGKATIDPAVDPAAKLYLGGQYVKAREAAQKVKDSEKATETAKADADFILSKVQSRADALKAKAEAAKSDRRYHDAIAAYEEISKGFKGTDESKAADAAIKEIKADKAAKPEMKAWEALLALRKNIEKMPVAQKKAQLDAFAKANEGTRAGEQAAKDASEIS